MATSTTSAGYRRSPSLSKSNSTSSSSTTNLHIAPAVAPGFVSVRHDEVGRGRIVELIPNRALLATENRGDILITPRDTFDDPSLDLTTRFQYEDECIYKAERGAETSSSICRYTAIFARRISDCAQGCGEIERIVQNNYAFLRVDRSSSNSSNVSSPAVSVRSKDVFFPTSCFYESNLPPYAIRDYQLEFSKLVRVGDRVRFLAVEDESTRGKAAYGLEITLDLNRDWKKILDDDDSSSMQSSKLARLSKERLIGIVLDVRRGTFDVLVKNFEPSRFYMTAEKLGFDTSKIPNPDDLDLRRILQIGTRIQFRAVPSSFAVEGATKSITFDGVDDSSYFGYSRAIRDVVIVDYVERTKLEKLLEQYGRKTTEEEVATMERKDEPTVNATNRSRGGSSTDSIDRELALISFDDMDFENLDFDSSTIAGQQQQNQVFGDDLDTKTPQVDDELAQHRSILDDDENDTAIDREVFEDASIPPAVIDVEDGGFWQNDPTDQQHSNFPPPDDDFWANGGDHDEQPADDPIPAATVSKSTEQSTALKSMSKSIPNRLVAELREEDDGSTPDRWSLRSGATATNRSIDDDRRSMAALIDHNRSMASDEESYRTAAAMMINNKETRDVECQTTLLNEKDLLSDLLSDREIFKLACDRYTELMHELWRGTKR